MYQSRSSSLHYDILHGIHMSTNLSVIIAYLSYFPPPPPIIPGPPTHRFRTYYSPNSVSSLSCFVSDNCNPQSSNEYIPLIDYNQTTLFTNISHTTKNFSYITKFSSLSDKIIYLFQNHYFLMFLLILLLSIILFLMSLLILFIYFQRNKQNQLRSNNKNKKHYNRLIQYRRQRSKTINNNEHNLMHLRKDSLTPNLTKISISSGIHTNNNNETEEAV
ncbi:unnamed protein product [Rotaria sp. Silwood2]|nr:unnamed protein product [Rotaria sp. Silwood2]CAF3093274.1 unnamed protein product [Rotaria sp. Silwood2]CAF3288042.1 unnamed protein product [Rotaria sp. Silwood2]CAF4161862.1 unnamed protein product [Rotaria sp. Silwood2]CAF4239983.1 unnamed protein product [Rotaria sp. Silwood2]